MEAMVSRKSLWRMALPAAICLAVVGALSAPQAWAATVGGNHKPSAHHFNVRDYGAVGDGVANDAPAVDQAIVAANASGNGIVDFPAGSYLAGSSIHMLSNVTLSLATGATLLGSPSGYDAPEPNPN